MEGYWQFLVTVTPFLASGAFEVGFVFCVTKNKVEVWVLLPEIADHFGGPLTSHLCIMLYKRLKCIYIRAHLLILLEFAFNQINDF